MGAVGDILSSIAKEVCRPIGQERIITAVCHF